MKTQKWWTTNDLAGFLNVSPATVRRRAGSGSWPCQRIGRLYRFTDEDVRDIRAQAASGADYHYDQGRIANALRASL